MKSEDIPAFVDEVASTGCNITGIASVGYVIGDADLFGDQFEEVIPKLNEITDAYGKHYHLLGEITEYLVSHRPELFDARCALALREKIKRDHLKP